MLDPAVKITDVHTVVGFDPKTTLPTRNVQVTYTVGIHGPFLLVTPETFFSQDYIEKETKKTADTLRAVGAVPHTP